MPSGQLMIFLSRKKVITWRHMHSVEILVNHFQKFMIMWLQRRVWILAKMAHSNAWSHVIINYARSMDQNCDGYVVTWLDPFRSKIITPFISNSNRVLNRGASFRWSFGPLSAWRRIDSTTILITHPSLENICFQSPFEFMAEEDYTCGIQSRMALLSQPDGDFDAIKMKTLFDLTFKVETLYDSISTSTSLQALTLTDDEV